MTAAERVSDFILTTDTPHLALTGELWGVYCEDLGENWQRYNATTLYVEHVQYTCPIRVPYGMIQHKDIFLPVLGFPS